MPEKGTFDLVILGAGPAGVASATSAALRGLSVALVSDGGLLGYGLEGAFKSKSLWEIASSHHAVRFRWNLVEAGYDVNFKALSAANRAGAEALRRVHGKQLAQMGVELVWGRGRFADPHTIAVGDRRLVGDHVIVATGTRPRVPPGFAVDGRHILTSDQMVDLDRSIGSLLVLGAGVIGCEFASILAAFGAKVTLIDTAPRIFNHDDPDISDVLQRSLERLGVQVLPSSRCASMQVVDERVVTTLQDGTAVTTECALLSIGRTANTDDLNLEAAGLPVGRGGYIATSDAMQTSVPHIYAVGDVGQRDSEHDLSLVHVGEAEGRAAVARLCGEVERGTLATDYVPFIIFTIPMVAGAGFSEGEARKRFGDVRVGKWANVRNHRSHAMQGRNGFVKLIVGPPGDDRVRGVRAIGAGVDAVVGETSVMIQHRLPFTHLLEATQAHPTLSESLQGAAQILVGQAPAYVEGEEWGDDTFQAVP